MNDTLRPQNGKGGHMRSIIQLGAGLALVAAGVTVPFAAEAFAYGPNGHAATVTVTVGDHPGGVIDVTVSGGPFQCGETVDVYITNPSEEIGSITVTCASTTAAVRSEGEMLPMSTSTATGSIDSTLQLPAGVPAGLHALTAVGTSSGDTGSTSFTTNETSQGTPTCAAAHTSSAGAGIVLAAAVETTSCVSQLPPAAVPPVASGGAPSAGVPVVSGAPKLSAGAPAQTPSSLPFTGADIAATAAAGAGAVLVGGLLVTASRRRRQQRWN